MKIMQYVIDPNYDNFFFEGKNLQLNDDFVL